ncbi:MAG: 4-demethylwyosine synthase TYW1 [Candidatus Aenigmarchaeota archaeon]|nr:4-demethylwyosine synthase TYW1 [Candidatus Aenigmarchaeota archaeon]
MLPENVQKVLKKQRYKIVGSHSAAKLCMWTRRSIRTGGKEHCYKEQFYKDIGIKSHRCMQCTPAVSWCSLGCQFCWRATELTLGQTIPKEDEPEKLVEGLLKAQRNLLAGLGGVSHDEKYLEEAQTPTNVALSLSGDPMCYSKMSELLDVLHKRKMKTFVVTNGTFTKAMENLETLPTQLYVSMSSFSKEMMDTVNRPMIKEAWKKYLETLDLFSTLKTRRAVRITLIKNLNMKSPEKYSELLVKASPNFVEVKSFMSVGFSRNRLPYSAMPTHEEIKEFSQKICDNTDYKIADEKKSSRVVLLKKK